jgi:hypothetical protein
MVGNNMPVRGDDHVLCYSAGRGGHMQQHVQHVHLRKLACGLLAGLLVCVCVCVCVCDVCLNPILAPRPPSRCSSSVTA